MASMLTRQLERRFGPLPELVRKRIEKADANTRESWAERLIDAPDLEALFEEH